MNTIEIPPRMRRLPLDKAGRPIPWFVADIDGVRDPRVADSAKWAEAVRFGRCWVCGGPTGVNLAFVIGPMCAVNRVTAEPGCHRECAIYSARACPFLATPTMRRRERGLDEYDLGPEPGTPIKRNPGVTAVWMTREWSLMKTDTGPLVSLGEPIDVLWFTQGRAATRDDCEAAITSGLPALVAACDADDDPEGSRAILAGKTLAMRHLLPTRGGTS